MIQDEVGRLDIHYHRCWIGYQLWCWAVANTAEGRKPFDRYTILLEQKVNGVLIASLSSSGLVGVCRGELDILLVSMSMVLGSTDCGTPSLAPAMRRTVRTVVCMVLDICCCD